MKTSRAIPPESIATSAIPPVVVRWLLVACALLASAPAVWADDRETARIHFEAAHAAETRGDWTTAIDRSRAGGEATPRRARKTALGSGAPAEPAFELEKAPPVTPSGGRPPTLTIGAAVGLATGIASAWNTTVAFSGSARLGGSFAL